MLVRMSAGLLGCVTVFLIAVVYRLNRSACGISSMASNVTWIFEAIEEIPQPEQLSFAQV